MPSFNKVVIVGRLGQDPEVRHLPNGTAVCEVSLACDRQWFDKANNQKKSVTDWIPVVFWARTAEILAEYNQKGSLILVEGRLETSEWTDRESGQKRTKLKVVCENMQMLGSGGGNRSERQAPSDSGDTGTNYSAPSGGSGGDPDEVPF